MFIDLKISQGNVNTSLQLAFGLPRVATTWYLDAIAQILDIFFENYPI